STDQLSIIFREKFIFLRKEGGPVHFRCVRRLSAWREVSPVDAAASAVSHPSRFFTQESPASAAMNLFFNKFTPKKSTDQLSIIFREKFIFIEKGRRTGSFPLRPEAFRVAGGEPPLMLPHLPGLTLPAFLRKSPPTALQ
ncbi:hypothetical protein, partial [Jeotgalibacillus proteolyticus]|uniref:hypothetical protein n=1 Tax=Jeotgalibacillus proteolyticus TaxID=2082395 RepID=UPI003CEE37AB